MTSKEKLAKKLIEELQIKRGWSYVKAATEIDISISHFRKIISCEVSVKLDTLDKIASALGCEANELI